MKSKKLRHIVFSLHRYIGLAVGLLLILIGLTGSLLVFEQEIGDWLTTRQFGEVVPSEQRLSPEELLKRAKVAYPNLKPVQLYFPDRLDQLFKLRMIAPQVNEKIYLDGEYEVFVNPYTGEVLG